MKRLALAVVLTAVSPAAAQEPSCGPRAEITAYLASKFAEQPVGLGLVGDRRLAELWLSEAGTWTMVVTDTANLSCIVAAGESWTSRDLEPGRPS